MPYFRQFFDATVDKCFLLWLRFNDNFLNIHEKISREMWGKLLMFIVLLKPEPPVYFRSGCFKKMEIMWKFPSLTYFRDKGGYEYVQNYLRFRSEPPLYFKWEHFMFFERKIEEYLEKKCKYPRLKTNKGGSEYIQNFLNSVFTFDLKSHRKN